ncbi:MAG: hypothetical protein Kow0074_12730 [Candidatus Zixiibacteriota bacterium]
MLRNGDAVILAWEEETHRVVGFITAVSDGVPSAYIPLLEVLRSHRRQGIGAELVHQMLEKLADLDMVDLTCDESVQPFCERFGFQRFTAMIQRRFERQGGSGP